MEEGRHLGLGGALLKLVDAAGGVHKFLRAGVERMRAAAHAQRVHGILLALEGGRGRRRCARLDEKLIAVAGVAKHHGAILLRMDVLFHEE